ncbi:peptide transporter PTR2, partial [Trifolium medium]|nr:peptide transporter PTR2 [Trifolium medium]
MIGLGDRANGLYRLVLHNPSLVASPHSSLPFSHAVSVIDNSISCNSNFNVIPLSALWHFRFGHLSNSRLSKMTHLYPNLSVDNNAICDICHFAKQRKLPFHSSTSIAQSNFELLHFDIWGPLSVASLHGHKYFLTIVDDHSRFVWIILLKSKTEVSSHIQNFITLVENQFHVIPKILRSDNGPEFMLNDFFAKKGIIHQKSCVETPQQNGRVERKHQHILNV